MESKLQEWDKYISLKEETNIKDENRDTEGMKC